MDRRERYSPSEQARINEYYHWLLHLIEFEKHAEYSELLRTLHQKEFYYTIPHDENREEDGKYLRTEFAGFASYRDSEIGILQGPCSVLEMLIALAARVKGDYGLYLWSREPGTVAKWFWIFLRNLGLKNCTDRSFDQDKVEYILNRFLDRDYEADGTLGLFPLKHPKKDQRKVEIWYQMQAYLSETLYDLW